MFWGSGAVQVWGSGVEAGVLRCSEISSTRDYNLATPPRKRILSNRAAAHAPMISIYTPAMTCPNGPIVEEWAYALDPSNPYLHNSS